jgi:peptide/nickel transport system substrate-binding protein
VPNGAGDWNGPDLARARRLVAASGTRGARVTVWGWTDDSAISPKVVRYAASVLRRLGYRTRVHLVPHDRVGALPETIQLIPTAWGANASGMFATWFACGAPNLLGRSCDPRIGEQLRRAQKVQSTRPRTAEAIWAGIDRRLVDQAASVPMVNELGLDFMSARVRNYQFHPYWGLIADQLWLAKPPR